MTAASDLLFISEAVKDLRAYVLSKDLFWPLQRKTRTAIAGQLPQLTLGNLAVSQARLRALELPEPQADEYARVSAQIAEVRAEWLSNWRIKEEQEIGSRLKLWQEYLRDLRGDPCQHAPYFAREVRNRVILELMDAASGQNGAAEQLAMLDQILRGLSQPGPFVWEGDYSSGFPTERFWFLYLSIKLR